MSCCDVKVEVFGLVPMHKGFQHLMRCQFVKTDGTKVLKIFQGGLRAQ